jgi:hypothetical protein
MCEDPCVRVSRLVLWAAVASSLGAVAGSLSGADQFAAQAGVLALSALAVYVGMARRTAARRVWWSLLTGTLVLAVTFAVQDGWAPAGPGSQRLVPVDAGPGTYVEAVVADERLTTLGVLVASAAFLLAVTALPAGRRLWSAMLTSMAGSMLIVVTAVDIWSVAGGMARGGSVSGAVGALVAGIWLPLSVALFAVMLAVAAAYRTVSRVVAVGGLLLAVSALGVVYLAVLSAPLPYGYERRLIFDAAVVRTRLGDLDPIAALTVAGCLAGAGCIAYGCLREVTRRI